jgi:ligand-binding sensor domain-containing protein/signal transduction histidine kinase
VLVCVAATAQARETGKAMSQYVREHWGSERGFPSGSVYAITQTADGYLWIGTEKGLVRFDGLNFHLFQQSTTTTGAMGPVMGLTADAEGNLWVRLQGAGLLRYNGGKFEDVSSSLGLPEVAVTAMCCGEDGEALFWGLRNGTFRYGAVKFLKLASMPKGLNLLVISMAEMPDGKIWMGTRDSGLFYLSGGQVFEGPKGLHDTKINCLLPSSNNQELWIGTDNGVAHWNGTEFLKTGLPPSLTHSQILAMTKDRKSNIWLGTADGLIRIDSAGTASRDEGAHQPMGAATALFEDREGNLWIGSAQGLERLHDSAFTTYSVPEGLPSESNGPIYVDSEGRTWFAPSEGGLYWLKEGGVGRVTGGGLDRDIVYSISGGKGELWIGRQLGGLTHLRYKGDSFETETYTKAEGLAQNNVYAVHESRDGTVWAGTLSGGLSRFRDGNFKTYTTRNGLASNSVASILESSDGTMWFGTSNGLNALSKGQWRIYTSRDGLPSGDVSCLLEDSNGTLWIGTANGLAFISSGIIQTPREVPESLHEQIFGMEEDRTGSLWIATANHILRVDRDKMLRSVLGDAGVHEYSLADGLRGTEGVRRHKTVVADSFGRIWFSVSRGLSVVDPTLMTVTSPPALVHVEGISADGRPIYITHSIRIPAPHHRVTFSYSALSLSVPERIRFKYKLDGFDQSWSEPSATREAVYTNLDSGSYRFHLIASNSEGIWNSLESTLQFEIEPAFWQSWWFRLSSLAAFAIAALAFVRLRMLKLTRQLNLRFEERLAERTRIAQELHDTLLQGFLSASMQLHVADDRLPADSPAKPLVGRVLELMTRVIEDGRNTLRGLRSPETVPRNLEEAFSRIPKELAVYPQTGFRILVEGTPRPLRSAIRDDLYFIGREALTNAFRHSGATRIEMEFEYEASHLRILVRDNGCGIDQQVLTAGRDGHWGLSGMRERADRIGARLRVLSRATAGTEIELSVPSRIAFTPELSKRKPSWMLWPHRRDAKAQSREVESGHPK